MVWLVGDRPDLEMTPEFIRAVDSFSRKDAVVAFAERSLSQAKKQRGLARDEMYRLGKEVGVNNSVPSKCWPNVLTWRSHPRQP